MCILNFYISSWNYTYIHLETATNIMYFFSGFIHQSILTRSTKPGFKIYPVLVLLLEKCFFFETFFNCSSGLCFHFWIFYFHCSTFILDSRLEVDNSDFVCAYNCLYCPWTQLKPEWFSVSWNPHFTPFCLKNNTFFNHLEKCVKQIFYPHFFIQNNGNPNLASPKKTHTIL